MNSQGAVDRATRRRLRTRAKLVAAARELIARKGLEGITIQQITETADVGFGSFYNHFPSKEALFDAVMEETVENWGQALDSLVERSEDSAEILAASIRYSLKRVAEEPTWGWFIYHIAPWMLRMKSGLVGRMNTRIRRGAEAGRFKTGDVDMVMLAAGGGIIATISAILHDQIGTDAPERIAAQCLILCGLSESEASEITQRQLPEMDWPAMEPLAAAL